MTRRLFLKALVLALGCVATTFISSGCKKEGGSADKETTVKVGILFSTSGTMAISETSLLDATRMAIDEINKAGGVLGKQIVPVAVNPDSNWDLYAEKSKELLLKDKVPVVFGCWTSVSRKSVLPVFEANNGLLFYPVQYEGEEQSANIFYTGATPNQQLIPSAQYLMSPAGGSKKKFFLVGTDYVFPRTANKILKAYLLSAGVPEANIFLDEKKSYTPFNHSDYQTLIAEIKAFAAGGDAAVLSTINGSSNVAFYKEFVAQGLTAKDVPIMAYSVAEDELRSMDTTHLAGHLATWNYYQSIDTPENKDFVNRFQEFCKTKAEKKGEGRVTDDPIEAAYFGVYVWKAAVEKAGSFDVEKVREAVGGLEFDAPGGKKKMHPTNHHTFKPVYVGEILRTGQFKVIWKSEGLVEPESFSRYLKK